MMTPPNTRVLVLGLDGATFDLLEPWIDEGRLPNLAEAIRRGVQGRLQSVVPPYSVPAWMSFATGKHPAKHGMASFWRFSPGLGKRTLNNAKSLRSATIWSIISDASGRVGVVSVPGTYPPVPTNGFVISGLMTPTEDVDYTFPPELKGEVLQVAGDYAANPYASVSQTAKFLHQVVHWERKREIAHRYLLVNREWDFFINVVQGLDPIQHKFWQYMDSDHPNFRPAEAQRYTPLLERCYAVADEIVGHRLSLVDERTVLFIISDHGFGPLYKYFHVNRFLADHGLIALKGERSQQQQTHIRSRRGQALRLAVAGMRHLDFLGLRQRLLDNVARYRLRRMLDLASIPSIDWARTQAYCGDASSEGIYIHRGADGGMSDLEYEKLREFLIEELNVLRDPDTGEPIIEGAYRREEIHHGEYIYLLPDIVLDLGRRPYLVTERLAVSRVLEPVHSQDSGRHRPDGIFVAVGPGIRRDAQIRGISLVDLAPTILYVLGISVPNDMDGRVLKEIFESDYLAAHPVKQADLAPAIDSGEPEDAYTDEETRAIQARLRALGYTE
jgi:predicted AlkP superfamily phosphohydrolase/phosphomutase